VDPLDFEVDLYHSNFAFVTMELHEAFIGFFEKKLMVLEDEDWISCVQMTLKKNHSDNSNEEEMDQTSTFRLLCQKADQVNKDLSDIRKLQARFRNYYRCCYNEYEDEGEDEDEKQKQKQQQNQKKQLLSDEAARLIKVMGNIAVDLGIPKHIESIHSVLYDVEKGGHQKRANGSSYFVNTENLTPAQLRLSVFAECLAHPTPEELKEGNNSHKIFPELFIIFIIMSLQRRSVVGGIITSDYTKKEIIHKMKKYITDFST
jgi:hypothetical protein